MLIHISYGYSVRPRERQESCFFCGAKPQRVAITYFGAPLCKKCWDSDWRQSEDGLTDPPFDSIRNKVAGEWLGLPDYPRRRRLHNGRLPKLNRGRG